jgi:DNA-binding response OmpR family regulator
MILLVASQEQTRAALQPLLASSGYDVAAVDCDDEIPNSMRFRKPSAVIIDCGVPQSSNLVAKIRADLHAQAVPVVMFSTDDQNLAQKALLQGADAYVPKGSLDWAELLAEVKRFAGPPTEN